MIANAFVEDGGSTTPTSGIETIAEVRERFRGPVPAAARRPERPTVDRVEPNMTGAVRGERRAHHRVHPCRRRLPGGPLAAFPRDAGRSLLDLSGAPDRQPLALHVLPRLRRLRDRGASPKPLVKVTGRRVETRPIAGTNPRGATRRRTEASRAAAPGPEGARRARDAGRPRTNDLGRVCKYGRVNVDELMVVETYSDRLHIVSQVSGRLQDGISAMDVMPRSGPPDSRRAEG